MSVNSKSISIPHPHARRSLWDVIFHSIAMLFYVIAALLRWINRNHNDYDIRAEMDELTPAERAAEKAEEEDNYEKNMREINAWSPKY
ncbi:MAG: hypothetical protein L0287_10095 [Anaerolineae bacterium]|nr:hypothetical protein [Anaerolineae bacterium]